MENQLTKVINESGLDKTKGQVLLDNFSNYFKIASDWENTAKSIVITSVEQKAEMKMAREGRLFLKEKRVAVEHTRKSLKENALREGQTIDAIAKILTNLILPIEEDLEHKEKFAELLEAKRKSELKAAREMELEPVAEYIPMGLDLSNMPEADYQKLLCGAKLQLQAQIDFDAKVEAERIAKEKAEAEEREKQRLENIRLKAEAEIKEKELKIERERAETERILLETKMRKEQELAEKKLNEQRESARLEAERAAREKAILEAEINARIEAEAESKKQQELAEKKAKNAPDKTKLNEFAKSLDEIILPEMKTADAQDIIRAVKDSLLKISIFIRQKAETL